MNETVTVTVTGEATATNVDSVTPTTTVNCVEIARTPGADQTNSLQIATDFVPGAYVTYDMLHMRGAHQVSWEIGMRKFYIGSHGLRFTYVAICLTIAIMNAT